MNWVEWHAAGLPIAALSKDGADGGLAPLHVRDSLGGGHRVVDILGRGPIGALVVCIRCGVTWNEGADVIPSCTHG